MDPNRKAGPIDVTPEEWAEAKRVCEPYPLPKITKNRAAEPHEPQDSMQITIMIGGDREITIRNPNFKEYKWQSETQPK